jgi:hypothetical protein
MTDIVTSLFFIPLFNEKTNNPSIESGTEQHIYLYVMDSTPEQYSLWDILP